MAGPNEVNLLVPFQFIILQYHAFMHFYENV